MSTSLFRENAAKVRASLAADLGCDTAAFDSHDLTIVPRPPDAREHFVALLATFGTGTVLSILPDYLDFARDHAPDRHFRAMYNTFLIPLLEEGQRRGVRLASRAPNLFFTLSTPRPSSPLPAGFQLSFTDRDWMKRYHATGIFDNAFGTIDEAWVDSAFRICAALLGSNGEPAAVASAWEEGLGVMEIGVDVAHEMRGRGFAEIVVTAAAMAILETGNAPIYSCAPTNVRSHRTALGCGFLPLFSLAAVREERP
jgi:hypothetical protein